MKDRVKNKVIVQSGVLVNGNFWYIAGNTNGLFKKDLPTGQIDFMGFFPQEKKLGFRLYSHVIYIDEKLIFAPCHAETIAIYHLADSKFTYIPLVCNVTANKYSKILEYKNNIYFMPYMARDLLKYDVSQEKLSIVDNWGQLQKGYEKSFVVMDACIHDNHMYIFTNPANQVIILDMDTDQFQVEKLEIAVDECMHSICKGKNDIWIVTNKNRIYQWNYVNGKLKMIVDLEGKCRYYTSFICGTDQYLYLINYSEKNIGKYDFVNNKFVIIDMNEYIRNKEDDCVSLYYYFDVHCFDNKLYMYSFYDGKYILVDGDKVTDTDILGSFYIPEEYWANFYNEIASKSCLMNLDMSFVEWLGHTLVSDKEVPGKNSNKNYVGKLIYDTVIKDVT